MNLGVNSFHNSRVEQEAVRVTQGRDDEGELHVTLLGFRTGRVMRGSKVTPPLLARTVVPLVEVSVGNGEEEVVCSLCGMLRLQVGVLRKTSA